MNSVNIKVHVKGKKEIETLVLYHKIYSTPYGIVNHWLTDSNCDYRLEIIIDEDDVTVNPSKIVKSLEIITDDWSIADQMMMQVNENKSFQFREQKMSF